MPVYLCKPGWGQAEPWKHGVPVYAYPFPLDETSCATEMCTATDSSALPLRNLSTAARMGSRSGANANRRRDTNDADADANANGDTNNPGNSNFDRNTMNALQRPPLVPNARYRQPMPIRRMRHSEVVLVDEVSIHYNRYWLRLRWPGSRGGIAGYIVVGGANNASNARIQQLNEKIKRVTHEDNIVNYTDRGMATGFEENDFYRNTDTNQTEDDNNDNQDSDNESTDDEPAILRPSEDSDSPVRYAPKCESTSLYFPSTTTMELLANYDDGLATNPNALPVTDATGNDDGSATGAGEPVFCRICREGLHEVDYDFKEMENQQQGGSAAAPPVASETLRNENTSRRPIMTGTIRRTGDPSLQDTMNPTRNESQHGPTHQPPVAPPAPLHAEQMNHPYADNPMLSPCECAGSMAFVHYLCIEQWRCRSNHPAARNGLNCETCNGSYTLPPPPARPNANDEEDWLEAMPPHVLAALRRPHIFWRIGAAVARRRWLRPIAPILTSPIVALYCRARRTLKKRGVSRRRWACSLCRRRARWKCVRCLRSYYCSRQCQNVSWHIVHKHVCYKPGRFWGSVVLYGLAFIYFFPGVLSYPLIYDLGLSFTWLSFVVSGIIGGGIATLTKRRFGIDIRGRVLEAVVVISTLWLAWICWGLVWAYFGEPGQCKGVFYGYSSQDSTIEFEPGFVASFVEIAALNPAKSALLSLDSVLLKTGPYLTKWICQAENVDGANGDEISCLELTQRANPQFVRAENGDRCMSDLNTIASFWVFAVFMHCLGGYLKRTDRLRRAANAGRHPRPHQD